MMETQPTFLLDDSLSEALRDQIDTILLILERPVVQWQLGAFLLVILAALAVPWLLRRSVDAVARRRQSGNVFTLPSRW